MSTEQHVNGKFTFFYYFHMTSLPVHHVRSCGYRRTQKILLQMKTKDSLTVTKTERNVSALPVNTCIGLVCLKG